jgi:exodeoxyribonuclease VII large subunit
MSHSKQPPSHPQNLLPFDAPVRSKAHSLEAAPARHIWAVSELVNELRDKIEGLFADLWVRGEISNMRPSPSGHLYFTLKDSSGQLPIVLFRRQSTLLKFRPQDGMEVLLRGRISVYEQRGQLQIIGEWMEPLGVGSLQIAFEQLREKLRAEGLFDADHKRALPLFPRTVGIVTSPTGSVIRDFLNILARRHSGLNVLLYPALVQGETAAAEVIAGIEYFNTAQNVDIIVLARGGGSLEDLAAFNSEPLARTIFASRLPVVSAIGHETDFTIADFVADLRAPTPSAAAELVTSALYRVEERLIEYDHRLDRAISYRLLQRRERSNRFSISTACARIQSAVNRRRQLLDELAYRASTAVIEQMTGLSRRTSDLELRLRQSSPARQLMAQQHRNSSLTTRLLRALELHVQLQNANLVTLKSRFHAAEHYQAQDRRARFNSLTLRLQALSPLAVLERGYSLAYDEQGRIVTRAGTLSEGSLLTTRFAEGSAVSRITKIENTGPHKPRKKEKKPA